jgi:hypothetical protein
MGIGSISGGNIGIPQRPQCTHDKDCPLDVPEMPGHRHRGKGGKLTPKNPGTHLGTLEDKYGEISKRPDDTHLKVLQTETGEKGLKKVIAKVKHPDIIM